MLRAIDVAKWFVSNNCDNPRDTYDGNMKLQKLIYFSQLIHLARTGDVLFEDPICAFANGSVIEDVRLYYKNNIKGLINEAMQLGNFSENEVITLQITEAIFCNLSAKELSELNHLHESWKIAYNRSLINGIPQKHLSEIRISDIEEYDLGNIRDTIKAYELGMDLRHFEVINGNRFYYNPTEITLTEQMILELEEFEGTDGSYVIYQDQYLGLVIV